jgi:serine/threonine protein kinase
MTQPQIAPSELVGPYRVVRAIGAGGSARVDLAVIERAYGFLRHVVLKRPLEHLRSDAHVAETLRREAHLGGRLRHPNLVAVLDAGTHDGYIYLALEYVAGSSVRTLMQADASPRVQTISLPAALSIVVGAARGLHEAHELAGADGAPLGLVHRDVSPANILVDRDGTVKLSDFGIAKDTRVNTLSGSMRGTVTYMAPEQCRGHAFDRRADVFSLGVILHELISGRRLFWAENDVASLHKVLSAPLPDPREAKPSLAPELCAIAMRAIARDASQRIASASELADRIEAFAARAGIVLGARAVAPLVAPTDRGPSEALTTQMPAIAITDEPSLVTVIEGAAEPDEPVEPTFGPNAAGDDEIATPVRQPTYAEHLAAAAAPTRSRRLLAGIVGACVVGGIAIGAVIAMRDSSSLDTSSPSTATPSPSASGSPHATPSSNAAAPSSNASGSTNAPSSTSASGSANADPASDTDIEMDPDDKPASTRRTRRDKAKRDNVDKRADKPVDKRTDPPVDKRTDVPVDKPVVDKPDPEPETRAPIDAGVPPKVEWNPKMVFPSDKSK